MAAQSQQQLARLSGEELAPRQQRYIVGNRQNNHFVDFDKLICDHREFLPILAGHSLNNALFATSSVSESYMHQFWINAKKVSEDAVESILERTSVTLTKDRMKQILQLPAANYYEGIIEYVPQAPSEDICRDIMGLGYDGVLVKTNQFLRTDLAEPWQTLFMIINKCLSNKHSGHERANQNIMTIFQAVAMHRHIDFINPIWRDFLEVVKTKDNYKGGKNLPYQRWTGLIIKEFMTDHPQAIFHRSDNFFSAQMHSLIKTKKHNVVNVVPKVVPLSLILLADQHNYHIQRYKVRYYDGNTLRANPRTDAELKVALQTVQIPQTQPIQKRIMKMRHDRPQYVATTGVSEPIIIPTFAISEDNIAKKTVDVTTVLSQVLQSVAATQLSTVLTTSISASTPIQPLRILLSTPITAAGTSGASLSRVESDSSLVSRERRFDDFTIDPSPIFTPPSIMTTLTVPVSSISAPAISYISIRRLSSKQLAQSTSFAFVGTSSVSVMLSSTQISTRPSTVATTRSVPLPIYTISTSTPTTHRRGSIPASTSKPTLSMVFQTDEDVQNKLQDFEEHYDTKLHSILDERLQNFERSLVAKYQLLASQSQVQAATSSSMPHVSEKIADDFSIEELSVALHKKLRAQYPSKSNLSFSDLVTYYDQCSVSAARKRRHDDPDDESDPHEGEKRQRTGSAFKGVIIQEMSPDAAKQTSKTQTYFLQPYQQPCIPMQPALPRQPCRPHVPCHPQQRNVQPPILTPNPTLPRPNQCETPEQAKQSHPPPHSETTNNTKECLK